MAYERNETIRRAAILVATLDHALAQQMLDSLPPQEAARIFAAYEALDEIDPEEQRDVLDEFRRVTRNGRSGVEAVEFTYSVPADATGRAIESAPPSETPVGVAAQANDDAEYSLVAEVLAEEQPQTIAAALARMEQNRAAAVFAALPSYLQTDVLDRIANLQAADDDAAAEVEAELQRRIEQQRARRNRAAASIELARRIVAQTPLAEQTALLARLPGGNATTTASVEFASAMERMTQQAASQAFANRAANRLGPGWTSEEPNWPETDGEEHAVDNASPSVVLDDRSRDLETLSDQELLAGLRLADERTVYRALAASSEAFFRRVSRKLPRRQVRSLRQMVRSIGPTRIAELRAAQHELLAAARSVTAEAA